MDKINICYIGYSDLAVKHILENSKYNLTCILLDVTRNLKEVEKIAETYHIKTINFTKSNFKDAVLEASKFADVFLIFWFGIIVPKSLTERLQLFNLHTGNLETNRGSSPISWSILNQEKYTSITLHKINEKIDAGLFISKASVTIEEDDNVEILTNKLIDEIPILLNDLVDYLKGEIKGEEVSGGVYRKPLMESDYTIDLGKDTIRDIKAKINCRSMFGGAILNYSGKKYYVNRVSENHELNEKAIIPIECLKGTYYFKVKEVCN